MLSKYWQSKFLFLRLWGQTKHMLLRKGFHQVKVKYGSNQLEKVGVEDGSSLHSFFGYCQCHTLISFGDDRWPTFGFLPAELSFLTLIIMQSIGFCDVSEESVQNTQNGGKMVTLGTFSSPWAHLSPLESLGMKQASLLCMSSSSFFYHRWSFSLF